MSKSNMELKFVNMAFATGSESKEAVVVDKFTGIAPVNIIGINPTVEELKKIYPGREYDKPVTYQYTPEGEGAPGVFVTFLVKVDPNSNEAKQVAPDGDLNLITRISFLIQNAPMTNKDNTKVQVINAYGETGWMLTSEYETKTLPEYMRKQNYLTEGMRPAFRGEEAMTRFIKMFLNIPSTQVFNGETRTWTQRPANELAQCMASFTAQNIQSILKGDVSAIKSALAPQAKNKIKALFGVRTTSDNNQYQDVCSRIPIYLGDRQYTRVKKELDEMISNGAYPNTEFGQHPYPFTKYSATPTNFTNNTTSSNPFEQLADNPFA